MCPSDPRYVPTPELIEVPVEPAPDPRKAEEAFWEKNADVSVEKMVKEVARKKKSELSN